MVTTTKAVAAKADRLRREQGVAILPLSEATGIPRTTLTRFLSGKGDMPFTSVLRLAHELKANAASWIDESDDNPAEAAA